MLDVFSALKSLRFKGPLAVTRYVAEKRRSSRRPFLIGLLSGLLLGCGPLQAMYVMAAGLGDPLAGAACLALFGLGTLPALLGFGLLARLMSGAMTHRFVQTAGVVMVVMGAMMLNNGLARAHPGDAAAAAKTKCGCMR